MVMVEVDVQIEENLGLESTLNNGQLLSGVSSVMVIDEGDDEEQERSNGRDDRISAPHHESKTRRGHGLWVAAGRRRVRTAAASNCPVHPVEGPPATPITSGTNSDRYPRSRADSFVSLR